MVLEKMLPRISTDKVPKEPDSQTSDGEVFVNTRDYKTATLDHTSRLGSTNFSDGTTNEITFFFW